MPSTLENLPFEVSSLLDLSFVSVLLGLIA